MIKHQAQERNATLLSISQRNNHQKATNTGKIASLQPRCKCCHLPYTKQSLKFSFTQPQILPMGLGILLYFRFILLLLIISLVSSCSYSIVSLVQNIQKYQQPQNANIVQNLTYKISNLSNIHTNKQIPSYILGLLSIILLVSIPIVIIIMEKTINKLYFSYAQFQYTQPLALLFRIEKPFSSELEIIKTINQWYEQQKKNNPSLHQNQQQMINQQIKQNNVVQKIYFHYDLKHLQIMKKQIQLLQTQTAKQQSQQNRHSLQITRKNINQTLQIKSQQINKKIQQLKQKIINKQIQLTNKFIVIFKSLFYRQYFRKQLSKRYCKKNQQNVIIFPNQASATVQQPPFPNQIYYHLQEIHYYNQKLKNRLLCWLFNIAIIVFGTAIQLIVLIIFKKYQVFSLIVPYFGFLVAVIFYLISKLGSKLSTIFIEKQYHSNQSSKNYSKFLHIFITNIFLKCISIIIIYQFSNINNHWQSNLIQSITWLLLITSFFLLLTKIINIKICKFIYNKYYLQRKDKKNLKQQQFNKLFQKPQNKIQINYAELVQFTLISFIYASITPISLLICFFFLLLYYLLERISFIHIYKQPQPSNDYLFLNVSTILWKMIPFSITIGQIYFNYILYLLEKTVNHNVMIIFLVIIGLNFLILFFPASLFKPTLTGNLSYDSIKQNIIFCYSQYNPLYNNEQQQLSKRVKSVRYTKKSDQLQQQLNIMSRSLQNTLKQKLFNIKNPCLQKLGNRQQLSQIYFQYDKKIYMPKRQNQKQIKYHIPPIFKISKQQTFNKNNNINQTNDNQLVKLNTLVQFQSQKQKQKIKNKIKGAIRLSINKIQ